jgi:hypothetical protein
MTDTTDHTRTDGGSTASSASDGGSPATPARNEAADPIADATADRLGEPAERTSLSSDTWGPTRASSALVLIVSVGLAWLLITQVGPGLSARIAFVDAVLLTASLWLVERDRWRAVTTGAAGVLSLFVGATFVGAVGYGVVVVGTRIAFSAPLSQLPGVVLGIVAVTMVLVGATLSMIGGVASIDNTLTRDTAWAYAGLAIKTFVVPFVVGLFMLVTAVLSHAEVGDATVGDLVGGLLGAFLAPTPGRTHVATFVVLVVLASLLGSRALAALPISELSTARRDGPDPEAVVTAVRRGLRVTFLLGTVGLLVGLLEFLLSPFALRTLLTPPVYDTLAALTTVGFLRVVPAAVAVVSLAVVLTVGVLRRIVRATDGVRLGPFFGGVAVVFVVFAVHDPVVDATIRFVADQLPEAFAEQFTEVAWNVVGYYGSVTLVMAAAALLVWLTTMLAFGLAAATQVGYLSAEYTAPALASVGLFTAAAFAGASGVGPAIVFAALVCSLLIWDAGTYATTLGKEVGRIAPTRGVELVHAGGTLAVGVVAATVTAGLFGVASGTTIGTLSTVPFAIVGVVVALVLLLGALR